MICTPIDSPAYSSRFTIAPLSNSRTATVAFRSGVARGAACAASVCVTNAEANAIVSTCEVRTRDVITSEVITSDVLTPDARTPDVITSDASTRDANNDVARCRNVNVMRCSEREVITVCIRK